MASETGPDEAAAGARRQIKLTPLRLSKRVFLGRSLGTAQLAHERLGKPTALAVFASDALSSVAYATEEILRVLVPAIGLLAFSFVVPISGAVVVVLAILLFSYRQTIKEYPTAGGAYIVTKDNFGLLPAQVAGVALLTDYILTVAVSVSAGVVAVTSAIPSLFPYRVVLAVFFIAVIAWGNLRGVKESGRIFAAPTYIFILSVLILLAVGIARALFGNLEPSTAATAAESGGVVEAAGLFLVLHAFASGGTAATGVEAISNGVPAFKPPEWRNARTTLVWMVCLLGTMFLGLSYLASKLRVVPDPDEKVSVLAQMTREVFGYGGFGRAFFILIQAATMLILVLAANTSFADFPRLASFHAGDNFLPRQFTKRGHRLVFSNGIIALAVVSSAMVIGFQASVTRLIPLYAIGVFTSFTLSQAGMARHHIKKKEPHWKMGVVINGAGAVATGLVDIIVAITKFMHGAWAIIVAVPILVALLVRMNHQYEREANELEEGVGDFVPDKAARHIVIVTVDEIDQKLLTALEFAKTVAPDSIDCIHVADDADRASALESEWNETGPDLDLTIIDSGRNNVPHATAEYVKTKIAGDTTITVVTPGPFKMNWWVRLKKGRTGYRLTRTLAAFPNVNVVVIRDHPGHFQQATFAPGSGRIHIHPRPGHEAIVLVDRIDRSVIRAVRYAQATQPLDLTCLHVAIDPARASEALDTWVSLGIDVPFEVIRCEDRDIGRAISRYVAERSHPRIAVSVIVPRRDYFRLWHRLLHDRTSRSIARDLYEHKNVYAIAVPYYVGPRSGGPAKPSDAAAPAGVAA